MARRKEFTVDTIPLVGGAVALDFLNTTGARDSERPRERLHAYADLIKWARRVAILDGSTAAGFRSAAGQRPHEARDALRTALSLREDLHAVFAPLVTGQVPARPAVGRLEEWLALGCATRTLHISDGKAAWVWPLSSDRLGSVLWPIIGSAEAVLTGCLERARKCGECDWVFLDASRNTSRQWCKKLCADRVRSRRYYRRWSGS